MLEANVDQTNLFGGLRILAIKCYLIVNVETFSPFCLTLLILMRLHISGLQLSDRPSILLNSKQ